ncbi:MAG: cell envelope integrity protein CreD [Moraxella sp.]|nr:cell envelope integrity protein CreD [Moraxella sp.]
MQKVLLLKGIVITALCLLFVIGLSMVSYLVYERQSYQEKVIDEIKQTHVREQIVATPFLRFSHTAVAGQAPNIYPVFAEDSTTKGALKVSDDTYKRGIYRAINYQASLALSQQYHLPATAAPAPLPKQVAAQGTSTSAVNTLPSAPTLELIIPVADLRGVNLPVVTVNNTSYQASFGSGALAPVAGQLGALSYLLVDISPLLTKDSKGNLNALDIHVEMTLDIAGIGSLEMIPMGKNSVVELQGNWQAPKFYGDVLPPIKSFTQAGFSASWDSPFLAQSNAASLQDILACTSECASGSYQRLGVDFVDENNSYVRIDRSIKYALLLLLVSFGTFFLFEVVRSLKIHPVQYGLVASALLTFYVLLLSLSEYILFWQAYAIAGAACVLLIGWYTSFMLHSKVRALIFMGILGSLYALFYVILTATEFNLLLGALFCFALVFVAMFVTRKIDWYGVK